MTTCRGGGNVTQALLFPAAMGLSRLIAIHPEPIPGCRQCVIFIRCFGRNSLPLKKDYPERRPDGITEFHEYRMFGYFSRYTF
jgi:hypothetical protein